MGTASVVFHPVQADAKYLEMEEYLGTEGGYWLREDKWMIESLAFQQSGLTAGRLRNRTSADFSSYKSGRMKVEMKYYLLYHMKKGWLSPFTVCNVMTATIRMMGVDLAASGKCDRFSGLEAETMEPERVGWSKGARERYLSLKRAVIRFISDFYDERSEFEKDVWNAVLVPGARLSATLIRQKPSLNFSKIPAYYRKTVKRFMERLVVKRSWSY